MIKSNWSYQVTSHGYEIFHNNEIVYTAGNHRLDTQQYAQPCSVNALDIKTLEKYAKQIMSEMIEERG